MSDLTLPFAASPATPTGVADWFALLKPRVMSLVVFTGVIGLLLAPGHLHPLLAMTTILCIAVGAGASGAINMWYERDIDALMQRTRHRPLPAGRIAPPEALAFGTILTVFAIMLLGLAANWVAAFWLGFASFFYVVIYTIALKRRTPHNIVIGGAAGAFPPVIGWAAVTGTTPEPAWLLFALIFFWTPPHFWALALYRNDDYARAGIPMLPVIRGKSHTRWQMLAYTLLLLPLSLAPVPMGLAGNFYGGLAGMLSLAFIAHALRVLYRKDDASARSMFFFSLLYLFGLFAGLGLDHLLRGVLT